MAWSDWLQSIPHPESQTLQVALLSASLIRSDLALGRAMAQQAPRGCEEEREWQQPEQVPRTIVEAQN